MRSTEFMELLLGGAPLADFDNPLLQARAQNLSQDHLAELEMGRALALQLHELLAGHRRHEAELHVLNDTATDLVSLRDLEQILPAIVDRARRLLECDLAYLSLSDEDRGDSYIEASSGNISDRLRGLRLPAGTGLGGKVSRTAAPCTTRVYRQDQSIAHTEEIDDTVAAEGIESLLGVPLKLGQKVIGVLLGAQRSERTFSSHDISLLTMHGAHAAAAIDNARLLAKTQETLEELTAADVTIRAHMEALERAAEVHERLMGLVIHGGGVEDMVTTVANVLAGAVTLHDETGAELARAGETRGQHDHDIADAEEEARRLGSTVIRDRACAVAMITESDFIGTLSLSRPTPVTDIEQLTLERAALVTSLVLVTRRRMAEAEARVRGELLEELLSTPTREYALLQDRASLLGVDLDECHVLVVAQTDGGARERIYAATAALVKRANGLATYRRHQVVLLLPGDDPKVSAQRTVQQLSRAASRPVTAGAASIERTDCIAAAYHEAARCVRALMALGRVGDAAIAEDLGFVGLLIGSSPDPQAFTKSVLGPLLEYDSARGTQLLHTVSVFCATGQSTGRTAQALYVHTNTVPQRLSRVRELLGEDWQEPDRLLEIQIALRLLELTETRTD